VPARRSTPASRGKSRRNASPAIGLALAGGGPLGAIYEIGCVLALSDSLDGLDFNELDVYVGVSSGSFVAAGLANGISPAQMYRLFIADGDRASALSPDVFLQPALREFTRRLAAVPALAARGALHFIKEPLQHNALARSFSLLTRAMPTGVFSQRAVDRFLASLFKGPGRSDDFRQLAHKLYVVATDLDSGSSVTFGKQGFDAVPIRKAIQASAALPGLFPPVLIDGRHYVDGVLNKTLHASAALEDGVELLLCINPLIPFDAGSATATRIRRKATDDRAVNAGGLPRVLAQTFRAIIHSRMEVGMDRYRREYPCADILLFEPAREDATMFEANVLSYAHRAELCERAYEATRLRLWARRRELGPLLARHGIGLRLSRLRSARELQAAIHNVRPLATASRGIEQAKADLAHTLDQLERWFVQKGVQPAHT
jgi:NTE family protein